MEQRGTKNTRNEIKKDAGYKKQPFSHTAVEYILHPDTTYRIFLGFTQNLSDSGLCLYTTNCLKKGQEIIVKSCFPYFYKKATVCWVEKYDSFYYRVGLEFSP